MAKKWNQYTRREKWVGIFAAIFGVFVIGSFASAMGNSSDKALTPSVDSNQVTENVKPQPVTLTKEVKSTEAIVYEKTTLQSDAYDKGTTRVTTLGVNGERTYTYRVTLLDGIETGRELIKDEVTIAPVNEVTTVGTYEKPVAPQPKASSSCDSNYSGACVPIASDVDCASGSGNGPAYVSGPVYVVGTDIYGLDRDGDGVGCE